MEAETLRKQNYQSGKNLVAYRFTFFNFAFSFNLTIFPRQVTSIVSFRLTIARVSTSREMNLAYLGGGAGKSRGGEGV